MKKILILSFILIFIFAACGEVDNDMPQVIDESEIPVNADNNDFELFISDDGEAAPVIDWMKSGTFSFDFKSISALGENVTYKSGSLYVVDDRAKIIINGEYEGKTNNFTSIIKEGVMYIYTDLVKQINQVPFMGVVSTEGFLTDYREIEFSGSGSGIIAGKTLPYDEYNKTGATIKFFSENGRIVGIESEVSLYQFKIVMVITNPTNKVPNSAFDFPENYEMKEMMEIFKDNLEE